MKDLIAGTVTEEEEKMAGSSNLVRTPPFQRENAGSIPVPATRIGFRGWRVEKTTNNINGAEFSRLSVT